MDLLYYFLHYLFHDFHHFLHHLLHQKWSLQNGMWRRLHGAYLRRDQYLWVQVVSFVYFSTIFYLCIFFSSAWKAKLTTRKNGFNEGLFLHYQRLKLPLSGLPWVAVSLAKPSLGKVFPRVFLNPRKRLS